MADPEHVERLKRSVGEWNKWREEHPEIQPDLRVSRMLDLHHFLHHLKVDLSDQTDRT